MRRMIFFNIWRCSIRFIENDQKVGFEFEKIYCKQESFRIPFPKNKCKHFRKENANYLDCAENKTTFEQRVTDENLHLLSEECGA